MKTSPFPVVFFRQLRFWTFHCTLNALPSFCIALMVLQLWESPQAIVAMLFAIATFILLYTTITSIIEPLADDRHVLSRSLKLGTKIRAWISGLSMLVVFTPAMSITPDFWCGFISVNLTNSLLKSAGSSVNLLDASGLDAAFFPVYLTTLLEGLILSFLLLMISFFSIMFLQARHRRKFFALADSR